MGFSHLILAAPYSMIGALNGYPYLGLNSFDLPEVFQQPMINKRIYDLPQFEEPVIMVKRHTANSIWRIIPRIENNEKSFYN
uniref:Uncharacterized protein n=1 Tax=Panagrolaimus davidi TaxID=227884 RepID=A0A914PUG1_9BILA